MNVTSNWESDKVIAQRKIWQNESQRGYVQLSQEQSGKSGGLREGERERRQFYREKMHVKIEEAWEWKGARRLQQITDQSLFKAKQNNLVTSSKKPVWISQLGEEFWTRTAELNQEVRVQKEMKRVSLFSSKSLSKQLHFLE